MALPIQQLWRVYSCLDVVCSDGLFFDLTRLTPVYKRKNDVNSIIGIQAAHHTKDDNEQQRHPVYIKM